VIDRNTISTDVDFSHVTSSKRNKGDAAPNVFNRLDCHKIPSAPAIQLSLISNAFDA